MALYQNTLPSRLILSNNHVANPAGTKDHAGHLIDTVEIADDELTLPGIVIMLKDGSLVPCVAKSAAEVKAAAAAAAAAPVVEPKPATPAPEAKADAKAETKVEAKTADKK